LRNNLKTAVTVNNVNMQSKRTTTAAMRYDGNLTHQQWQPFKQGGVQKYCYMIIKQAVAIQDLQL